MITGTESDYSSSETRPSTTVGAPQTKCHSQGNQCIIEKLATINKEIAVIRSTLQEINAIQAPLVGIDQVALYFGKSQDTIRRWVKDRVISSYKIPNNKGNVLLFSFRQLEGDLADYLQERL